MSFIFRGSYREPDTGRELTQALADLFAYPGEEVVFLCIGTDKNILDCLGPLVGTMLKENRSEISIYGTLDKPVHARNLVPVLRDIRRNHPHALELAVDACLGKPQEIGLIRLKAGSLEPGKALNKSLPAVGDVALTGTVAAYRPEHHYRSITRGSFAPVYHMARVISTAILGAMAP